MSMFEIESFTDEIPENILAPRDFDNPSGSTFEAWTLADIVSLLTKIDAQLAELTAFKEQNEADMEAMTTAIADSITLLTVNNDEWADTLHIDLRAILAALTPAP